MRRCAILNSLKLFQHTAAQRRLLPAFTTFGTLFECFNTQPRRGGCTLLILAEPCHWLFQHTAAQRRLPKSSVCARRLTQFQHTAAQRRLPKKPCLRQNLPQSFNTQPRRGGCLRAFSHIFSAWESFNTQPRRGGCPIHQGFYSPRCRRFNTQPRRGGCLT